jgi:hypothetical protein
VEDKIVDTLSDGFMTKAGIHVPLRAPGRWFVSQILEMHPVPSTPIYFEEKEDGTKERHEHDEESLGLEAWIAYEEKRDKAVAERMVALVTFLVCYCVIPDPPPPEEWSVDFELFGLEPPDQGNPKAYKLAWVENELCPAPEDWAALMSRLMDMAGLVEEGNVEAYEGFFRATLARLGL